MASNAAQKLPAYSSKEVAAGRGVGDAGAGLDAPALQALVAATHKAISAIRRYRRSI
jgi:hypothetical protein